MDSTFHALGRILLNAIPTFFVVLFLITYLRWVFFKPLATILKQRYEDTEGARKAAEESMVQANQRIQEFEGRLRAARNDVYTEQDRALKAIATNNASELEKAKREAERHVATLTAELKVQAEESRRILEAQSGDLADQIVSRVLEGRAA